MHQEGISAEVEEEEEPRREEEEVEEPSPELLISIENFYQSIYRLQTFTHTRWEGVGKGGRLTNPSASRGNSSASPSSSAATFPCNLFPRTKRRVAVKRHEADEEEGARYDYDLPNRCACQG